MSLSLDFCRQRQRRLLDVMQRQRLDRVALVAPEHVQYLTSYRPHRLLTAAVVLDADGTCLLAAPNQEPAGVAADRIVTFPAQWHATIRHEQFAAAAAALGDALRDRPARRIAVEHSRGGLPLLAALGIDRLADAVDIEPALWQQRRRKDPDELALIRQAIAGTEAMYHTARETIAPGLTELDLYSRLFAAAVAVVGEQVLALGNDFQCNSPGGPPRNRPAQAGELWILDIGLAYRGYYADNCRTFAVDRQPTDAQQRAWSAVVSVLQMVEATVRPGGSCRGVFREAQQMLDDVRPGSFIHHLGHGIGLNPHEGPHLNPHWDDTFAEGDVFTAEPGLYADDLRAGLRLEQDYRVTADGVERLVAYPLDL